MALYPQQLFPFCTSGKNSGDAHQGHPTAQAHYGGGSAPSPLLAATSSLKEWRTAYGRDGNAGLVLSGRPVRRHVARWRASSSAGGMAVTVREEAAEDLKDPAEWSRVQKELVGRTLDLEGLKPSPARRAELVEQALAGAETGLFYISNFGVDQALLADVRAEILRFFSQPLEEKVKTRATLKINDGRTYGYGVDFGGDAADTLGATLPEPKIREVFRLRVLPESHRVEKVWPPALPSFREKMSLYGDRILAAAHFLGGLLTEGLGLSESYISDTYGPLLLNLVLASRLARPPGEGKGVGLPTHTDSNLFDFHVADGVPGLEVFHDGGWFTVPPLLDRALFTIGEDMETLSNGKCHAVYHRVAAGTRSRQSFITTCDVGREEFIGPAPQLIDDHNPARYLVRKQADRTDHVLQSFHRGIKPDRTKTAILVHPDRHLDRTKNVYYHREGEEELLYINGEPLLF